MSRWKFYPEMLEIVINDTPMTSTLEPVPTTRSTKLGEELPVFCERCGYSLYNLPQMRCEHCTILQFHCPECGHHQPINTLRPAAQTLIGRLRAALLVLVVLFKLNLFGWLLFAWVGMGAEWTWEYDRVASEALQRQGNQNASVYGAAKFEWESVMAFLLLGLGCGMVWRMALLRWKRSWIIGLIMGTLVLLCISIGVALQRWDMRYYYEQANKSPGVDVIDAPYTQGFVGLMFVAFAAIIAGCVVVWPLWSLLVKAFLPSRLASMLLNWQLSQSENSAPSRLAQLAKA